jgi:hypothetical protein
LLGYPIKLLRADLLPLLQQFRHHLIELRRRIAGGGERSCDQQQDYRARHHALHHLENTFPYNESGALSDQMRTRS